MSPGSLLGIRHCVRLRGHVVIRLHLGVGVQTHTHTADSLCRLCRGWGRAWGESPDTLSRGCPSQNQKGRPSHLPHYEKGPKPPEDRVPFAHFPHPTCVLMWIPELMTWGLPPLLLPELRVKEEGAETYLSCQPFTCLPSAPALAPLPPLASSPALNTALHPPQAPVIQDQKSGTVQWNSRTAWQKEVSWRE